MHELNSKDLTRERENKEQCEDKVTKAEEEYGG